MELLIKTERSRVQSSEKIYKSLNTKYELKQLDDILLKENFEANHDIFRFSPKSKEKYEKLRSSKVCFDSSNEI